MVSEHTVEPGATYSLIIGSKVCPCTLSTSVTQTLPPLHKIPKTGRLCVPLPRLAPCRRLNSFILFQWLPIYVSSTSTVPLKTSGTVPDINSLKCIRAFITLYLLIPVCSTTLSMLCSRTNHLNIFFHSAMVNPNGVALMRYSVLQQTHFLASLRIFQQQLPLHIGRLPPFFMPPTSPQFGGKFQTILLVISIFSRGAAGTGD
jgi:hypothetical protein